MPTFQCLDDAEEKSLQNLFVAPQIINRYVAERICINFTLNHLRRTSSKCEYSTVEVLFEMMLYRPTIEDYFKQSKIRESMDNPFSVPLDVNIRLKRVKHRLTKHLIKLKCQTDKKRGKYAVWKIK